VLAAGLAPRVAAALVPWGPRRRSPPGRRASLAAARRLAPGPAAAFALGAWAPSSWRFAGDARRRGATSRPRRATDPGRRSPDVVLTPGRQPVLRHVIVVEAAGPGGAAYRLTTAWAAAAPAVVSEAGCRPAALARGSRSLAMAPSPRRASRAVGWDRTWEAPLAELRALARGNCQVAAVLRFARAPFWRRVDAATLHVGDLRYARGPDLGFAEVVVPERPAECPRRVPPWRPPRADLLGGGPIDGRAAAPAGRAG
jgi:hypothetical protein